MEHIIGTSWEHLGKNRNIYIYIHLYPNEHLSKKHWYTVDGRNPASPWMVETLSIMDKPPSNWCRISSIHSIIGTSWENIGKSIDNPLYMEVLNSFHGYSNYINGGWTGLGFDWDDLAYCIFRMGNPLLGEPTGNSFNFLGVPQANHRSYCHF